MKKQLGIFLAGILVIVPFALTVYIVIAAGAWLNRMGNTVANSWGWKLPPGLGAVFLLVIVYLIGLLTRFWLFRFLIRLLERIVARLPGVKTIYESIRDLMKLFGGDSRRMGRAVLYTPPGAAASTIAILTNPEPQGMPEDLIGRKVAIYVPFSYMFGGVTLYVDRQHVRTLDLPVEQALKLAATAQVTREDEFATDADSEKPPL